MSCTAVFRVRLFAAVLLGLLCRAVTADSPGVVWSVVPGGELSGTPAYSRDGRVIFAAEDRWLYSFDAGGVLQWRFDLRRIPLTGPAIGRDGVVYIGIRPNGVVAVTPGGRARWAVTGSGAPLAVVPVPGGAVYTVFREGEITARTPRGGFLWSHQLPHRLTADPVLSGTGNLVTAAENGTLAAFDSRGQRVWTHDHGLPIESLAATVTGGVLAGDSNGALLAIDRSGALRWRAAVLRAAIISVHVDGAGDVLVVARDGAVARVGSDGTVQWTARPPGGGVTAAALAGDGTAYLVTADGRLLALDSRGRVLTQQTGVRGNPYGYAALTPAGRLMIGGRDWVVDLVELEPAPAPARQYDGVLGEWANRRGDVRADGVARGYRSVTDYRDTLDFIYLDRLVRSEFAADRERALRDIEQRVTSGRMGGAYAYLPELLLALVQAPRAVGGEVSPGALEQERQRAVQTLAQIVDGGFAARLARILVAERSNTMRVALIEALGDIAADPDREASAAIERVVRHPDAGDREARAAAGALYSIAQFNGGRPRERAVETLRWMSAEARFSRDVRDAAAQYLRRVAR
ncbi:MAG: hypothetical protein EA384_06725 [Spirochaetaceae bacterium]|nr:MAG: hypothetical protein EA384_06725 [Spirochaetaceae bacterium]